jgi:hypothetical protein
VIETAKEPGSASTRSPAAPSDPLSRITQHARTQGIAPTAVFKKRQGTRSARYEEEKRAKALLFRALHDDDDFSYGEIGSAIGWTQEAVICQVKKGRSLATADPAADPRPGSRPRKAGA